MPALTPEHEMLKQAAQDLENEPGESFGNKVQVVNRYQRLANHAAILALLAQLEAQEAPTSGDIILCGCMPADLGYAPPKLEWEEAPSVPAQTGIDQQAGGESAPKAAESRMDTGLQAGGQVAARGVSTLPSTPLPDSAGSGERPTFRDWWTAPNAKTGTAPRNFMDENSARAAWFAALQQPVQAVPDILLDGMAVYEEVQRKAGHMRTSPENVSDVLDAVVRLIRAAKAAPGEPGQ